MSDEREKVADLEPEDKRVDDEDDFEGHQMDLGRSDDVGRSENTDGHVDVGRSENTDG